MHLTECREDCISSPFDYGVHVVIKGGIVHILCSTLCEQAECKDSGVRHKTRNLAGVYLAVCNPNAVYISTSRNKEFLALRPFRQQKRRRKIFVKILIFKLFPFQLVA